MQLFITYNGRLMEYVLSAEMRREEIPLQTIGLNISVYVEKWLSADKEQWHFVESTGINVLQVQQNSQGKRVLTPCASLPIKNQTRYLLGVKGTTQTIGVYTQQYIAHNQVFVKYRLPESNYITVGTQGNCILRINRKVVAPIHFELNICEDGTAQLKCNKEVYVNNILVNTEYTIYPFDTLYLAGVKLVYLPGIIAVNSNNCVTTELRTINELDLLDAQSDLGAAEEYTYFSRAPRQLTALTTSKIAIEAPPQKKVEEKTPWFLTIGPTITMPMPMLCSIIINMTYSQRMYGGTGRGVGMYIGMFVSMILTALLGLFWGAVRKHWQKKQDTEKELKRVTSYTKYISNIRDELQLRAVDYVDEMQKQFLTSYEMATQISRDSLWLWNRNTNHSDFGSLRIGTGTVVNETPIEIQKERFNIDDTDALQSAPLDVQTEYRYITNAPVLINLFERNMVGVTGDKEQSDAIMNSMIVQLAGLYSYTDLKIAVCTSMEDKEKFMWARFLPHMQISDTDLRLFVYDRNSCERVISYVVNLIQSRAESTKENTKNKMLPHYVIFCTDEKLLESDAIRNYANSNSNLGITFVLMFGSIAALPNNCTYVLQNDAQYRGINILTGAVDLNCTVDYEQIDSVTAENFARELCGYTVKEAVLGTLPTKVNFLETLGVAQIEEWDLKQHYKEARTYESIRGLIGVGCGGALKYLDIHEKKHGPHGLIAGMTGSGKSEMLQTIIVSWAMTYSPEELAFVLIDYKGGGMANLFAGLPHVVGVLTNLSDESDEDEEKSAVKNTGITNRALVSIKAEIKRRQAVFKKHKINHIDDYIKMYHRGEVIEPLPHLVIISDEFAELRKEQHDFISELVSAARVGRSLGVHLILATQKPAGVVDDEISSNARYRLSLRVQDKADSMSMLKRPEAAYLTQIGRLYMQVGSDEIFEEIQAAYSGGYYYPQDAQNKKNSLVCDMVCLDGSVIEFADTRKKAVDKLKLKTELETCVNYVTEQVHKLGIKLPAQLWLPFLPEKMYLSDIKETVHSNGVNVIYGVVDDITRQSQYPLMYNCNDSGNTAIVGNSGCGKTTLLQTMLYTFATKYTAEDVQFYIYDYSSRILKMFTQVAHCGGVILNDESEVEKAQRTMQLFMDIMAERRDLFDKEDVGSFTEYNNLHRLPIIYLIIDDFASWRAAHLETLGDKLITIMRDGGKYGIYVIITVNTTTEIVYKMTSYINTYIALMLQERSAYRELCAITPSALPTPVKGRGLTVAGNTLAEYQVLLPVKHESEVVRNSMIKQELQIITEQSVKIKAKRIPVLPKGSTFDEIMQMCDLLNSDDIDTKMLIGYNIDTIEPIYLKLTSTFLYTVSDLSSDCSGGLRLLKNMYTIAEKQEYIIKYVQLTGTAYTIDNPNVISTDEQLYDLIRYINNLYNTRDKEFREYLVSQVESKVSEKILRQQFVKSLTPVFVFIDNLHAFVQQLQSESICKFSVSEAVNLETALITKPVYNYMKSVFERGAGYGIYFVACFDKDAHTQRALDIYNSFHNNSMGIHFGGCISAQTYVNGACIPGGYKQQSKELPTDNAVLRNGNNEMLIWVP